MSELQEQPPSRGDLNKTDDVDPSRELARDPFAERLTDDPDSFRKQLPDHYIKFRTFWHSTEQLSALDTAGRTKVMAHARQLWHELGDPKGEYKVSMPHTDYIIGHEPPEQLEPAYISHQPEEKKPGYYSVSEEVIGTTLAEEVANPNSYVTNEEIDNLFSTLGKYYFDKLQNGGDFLVDMKIDQFMCGHLADRPEEKRIFLVDQEPLYGSVIDDGVSLSGGFDSLRAQAYRVAEMVLEVERLREVILGSARTVALELLKALPPHPAPYILKSGAKYDPTEKLIAILQAGSETIHTAQG